MHEKRLFSILVRMVGIFFFMDGFRAVWSSVAKWVDTGMLTFAPVVDVSNLILGLIVMAAGVAIFRRPGWVVDLAWLERLPTIGRMTDDQASN